MAIPILRTSWRFTQLRYQISLKIEHATGQTLGDFGKVYSGSKPYNAVKHVPLYHRLPASGRNFYREMLLKLSRQNRPFELDILPPFLNTSGVLKSVALGLSSTAQMKLSSDIATLFKDAKIRRKAQFLAFSTGLMTLEDAERNLEIAREDYKKGPRSFNVVGLTIRHYWEESREGRLLRLKGFPPSEDFLFLGVDEEEKRV